MRSMHIHSLNFFVCVFLESCILLTISGGLSQLQSRLLVSPSVDVQTVFFFALAVSAAAIDSSNCQIV